MNDIQKIFADMKEMGAACYSMTGKDKDDNPTYAVIFVEGKQETEEILKAVRKVEDSWHD